MRGGVICVVIQYVSSVILRSIISGVHTFEKKTFKTFNFFNCVISILRTTSNTEYNATKGLSLTSNAGRDDMIFDPPKFQIPKI